MKKTILIVLLFTCTYANSQNRVKKKHIVAANNDILLLVIGRDGVYNGITALSFLSSNGTRVYSTKKYADMFLDSIHKINTPITKDPYQKYSKVIYAYLNGILSFGETSNDVYIHNNNFPFAFTEINGKLSFIQSGIFSKYFLNTNKLNADERANRVAKSIALPSLINFKPFLDIAEIKYFVVDCGYMAKDFSEELPGDGELISIVISRELLIKYLGAQITDADVFKEATFYNINKNSPTSVRKLTVN